MLARGGAIMEAEMVALYIFNKNVATIRGILDNAYTKKPLVAASCRSLIFGSPGLARSNLLVGRSHVTAQCMSSDSPSRNDLMPSCSMTVITASIDVDLNFGAVPGDFTAKWRHDDFRIGHGVSQ